MTLPWLGGTFRAQVAGVPAASLAVAVRGLATQTVALQTILPQAGASCSLLVNPIALEAYTTGSGTFSTALPLPNIPALAGSALYEQAVALEIGSSGDIVAVSSTNALALTIGVF